MKAALNSRYQPPKRNDSLNLRIPQSLKAEIQQIAMRDGTRVTHLVERWIRNGLASNRKTLKKKEIR